MLGTSPLGYWVLFITKCKRKTKIWSHVTGPDTVHAEHVLSVPHAHIPRPSLSKDQVHIADTPTGGPHVKKKAYTPYSPISH